MLAAAGVDTWSVCWYLREDSSAHRAMKVLATEPAARSRLLPDQIEGHRIGWFPGTRLLFAEGHPSSEGLCNPADLPDAYDALTQGLEDYGILPQLWDRRPVVGARGVERRVTGGVGFGGLRRLDSTVDLGFASGLEGLAALAGVAALPMPRCKTKIVRESGGRRVETVYFHG